MKRARLGGKDPRASSVPAFIRPHVDLTEDAEGPASGKSAVWRPNWGIRKKDTFLGCPSMPASGLITLSLLMITRTLFLTPLSRGWSMQDPRPWRL